MRIGVKLKPVLDKICDEESQSFHGCLYILHTDIVGDLKKYLQWRVEDVVWHRCAIASMDVACLKNSEEQNESKNDTNN